MTKRGQDVQDTVKKKAKTDETIKGRTQESEAERLIKTCMTRMECDGAVRQTTAACALDSLWHGDHSLLARIQTAVVWVSRIKARATLFLNWYTLHLASTDRPLPRLKDTLFTKIIAAVCGRTSPQDDMTAAYEEFCRETSFSTLPWHEGNSQIMCHLKNELVTAAETSVSTNFFTRRLSFLRWKVVNIMGDQLLQLELASRKQLVHRITSIILRRGGLEVADYKEIPDLPLNVIERVIRLAHREEDLLVRIDDYIRSRISTTWMEQRLKKSKKTREELEDVFGKLSIQALVEEDPFSSVLYFYWQSQEVEGLEITALWRTCSETRDFKGKWPWWKKVRPPTFSPVPLNRIGRHFIRIDKKQLVEWKVKMDSNQWWMSNVLDLYASSKRGRIHQLYEWRHLQDPTTARIALEVDELKMHDRPALPGASFTTDGISVHVGVYTFPSTIPNRDKLSKAGYGGIVSPRKIDLSTTISGIYKLEYCKWGEGPQAKLKGVDPGVVSVVSSCTVHSSQVLESGREDVLQAAMNSTSCYLQEEYKKNTGRDKPTLDERRRLSCTDYQEALARLSTATPKTFSLSRMKEYVQARGTTEAVLEHELHNIVRSMDRRKRFRQHQICTSHIVHKLLDEPSRHKRRKMRKQGQARSQERTIVFFGRALFSGTKGHVTVPRKKLIRELSTRCLVVLTDEYNTSKLCPYDFAELTDAGDRVRQCETESHGHFSCDRDVIGAANILQKAVYELLGRKLTALYPSA